MNAVLTIAESQEKMRCSVCIFYKDHTCHLEPVRLPTEPHYFCSRCCHAVISARHLIESYVQMEAPDEGNLC
jgi:hypothetical protein